MADFTDKTAIVTGGTGGVGAEVCRRLAWQGATVSFTYRSDHVAAARLRDELEALGARSASAALDLRDPDAVAEHLGATAERYGSVDVVVHAAGPHVPMVHLSRVSPEQMSEQLLDDGAAFFNLVHAAIPHLRSSRGAVVAVTSAATRRYPVRDGLSAGPKAAVESLARAFAAEEGRYGIRVNCVGPGMLHDGMSARLQASGDLDARALEAATANIPMRCFGRAADIAEAVCFLASSKAGFITGQKLDVDGGYGIWASTMQRTETPSCPARSTTASPRATPSSSPGPAAASARQRRCWPPVWDSA